MSSGCGDVLSLEDLKTAKKHQLFEAEVITGKQGGVAGGVDIDYATNQVTSQIQKTLPAVLRDAGFTPASFDFTTGGTLSATDRNKAVYDPVSMTWYLWKGTLPHVVAPGTNPVGDANWNPWTDPKLRSDLASTSNLSLGDALIGVKQNYAWAQPTTQHKYNGNAIWITDIGAASGVASSTVDANIALAIKAGFSILLPDGFNWLLSAPFVCPQNYNPTPTDVVKVRFICPNGRAKISMSTAGLMFDQNNTNKFELGYFKAIDFVGADKQNTASKFMDAPEGRWCSNFVTEDCSWDGFHTVWRASMIATKHYNAKFWGCGDSGAIVFTYHWTTSLFSAFNLNDFYHPHFNGKFGYLFQILGGFNNTFHEPWYEKVEMVGSAMHVVRQMYNLKYIGGWLENFKVGYFLAFDAETTEGLQSDLITFDGMHINNNWISANPGNPSGFTALVNRSPAAGPGNNYDTKFIFHNLFEHSGSTAGWALTRTGSTLNLASTLKDYLNNRLKAGQPDTTDGTTLAGSTPDIVRSLRGLSSDKFDLLPGNYGIISRINKTGSQKDVVFDDVDDSVYFRRNSIKTLQIKPTFVAPGVTNASSCGTASFAWSGGFTQAAFTVLSDATYKMGFTPVRDDNAEMSALLNAWGEVEFSMYQYIDRVEEKGKDGARWHFGLVAQRIVEALTRHGLDWSKYAFICHDEWGYSPAVYDEETGELMHEEVQAGSKFGIRYEEALVVEAAYMRRELERLKAK